MAVLRRYGLEADENVVTAAELAGKVARGAPVCGRPLFAANRALPWPDEPLAALWQATTLLREHRGDTHTAVLSAAGVTGRESMCCMPRQERSGATTSPAPATTTTRNGSSASSSWRRAGCSPTTGR